MITITLDEIKKMPPLSKKEVERIKKFKNLDFSDCPVMTEEQLKQFKPAREVHPEWFVNKKIVVH